MYIIFIILTVYLMFINLIAVIVTAYDKFSAVKKRRRVREKSLFLISLLGGSLGMYVTMLLIRHKTRHLKFMLALPVLLIIQLIAVYLIWRMIYG